MVLFGNPERSVRAGVNSGLFQTGPGNGLAFPNAQPGAKYRNQRISLRWF